LLMSRLNLKQKFLGAAAAAILLGLSPQAANADTINQILTSGTDSTPLLSDNSAEYLINAGGATDTTVDVGDRLRGILQINSIENGSPLLVPVGSDGNSELTALFDVVVTGKYCTAPGIDCRFTFGAYAGFATVADGLGFALAPGAAIAFFEDTNGYDFTRTDGIAAGIVSATDGDAFWLFGFDGIDDFWAARTDTDDISDVQFVESPGNFGTFNAGLSLLDNPFGIDLGDVACTRPISAQPGNQVGLVGPGNVTVNACASGVVIAPDETNEGFQAWDDVNFRIALVPEPGTLSIVGLGLLGLGYASRRRKNKKA